MWWREARPTSHGRMKYGETHSWFANRSKQVVRRVTPGTVGTETETEAFFHTPIDVQLGFRARGARCCYQVLPGLWWYSGTNDCWQWTDAYIANLPFRKNHFEESVRHGKISTVGSNTEHWTSIKTTTVLLIVYFLSDIQPPPLNSVKSTE